MTESPQDDNGHPVEAPEVAQAASQVAAGERVEWPTMESTVSDEESRSTLRSLHDVERIASFHRSWRGDPPSFAQNPPASWGPLTDLVEIGRGSFGRVYRAWDASLQRHVALKILDQGTVSESPGGTSAIGEARSLAQLRHPNIVTIHGVERVDGCVGLEMELIAGRTLSDIVRSQGPFAEAEAALICRDVCRALAAVHRAGLVHRDVKAQNVVREKGGRIVLMDFGAVRVTDVIASAGVAGTPVYLAPEVLTGDGPTPRSDIYSVGVLLFYLVTGSFPVHAESVDGLRTAHASGTPVSLRSIRPELSDRFTAVTERALAADPEARIESAGTFEAELSRTLTGQKPDATPDYWPILAGIAVATAAGAVVWALWPL